LNKLSVFHNFLGSFSNFLFLFLTNIVLLPYYFKFIDITEYGIWLGGISFLSLAVVLEANISMILTQQLAEKWIEKKLKEFSKYFTAALFFGVIVSIIIILFTYIFRNTLSVWVSHDVNVEKKYATSFCIYSIYLALTIISSYCGSISQIFLKTLLPPFFNIISSIFGIFVTIYAIPHHGIIAIAIGSTFKAAIYCLLVYIYTFKILREKYIYLEFDISYVFDLVKKVSLPFISKIGMTIAGSMQNFIIATSISASATAIFDITRKLPLMTQSVINMVAASTFTSFSLYYSGRSDNNESHQYTKYFFSLIRILLLISLMCIFLLGQDFISLWVGIDNFGGNILLSLLCILAFFDQLRLILSQQYYAIGKFDLISITDSLFAIAFMIFALILIPYMKLKGIVLAGLIANAIFFVSCKILENRNHVNMVGQIINKNLIRDLVFVAMISFCTKSICDHFQAELYIYTFTITVAILFLFLFFYKNEFQLYIFLKSMIFRKVE
jgi:O-antigen/teichoic acid export membrane protein